jgi:hypothetical protein
MYKYGIQEQPKLGPDSAASMFCASLHSGQLKLPEFVERWVGELMGKRIRRGASISVDDLVAAIDEYTRAWNANPKPFIWADIVELIMAKLSRCNQTLKKIQPGYTSPRSRKTRKNNTDVYETVAIFIPS